MVNEVKDPSEVTDIFAKEMSARKRWKTSGFLAEPGMNVWSVDISPQLAAEWMGNAERNRKISGLHVDYLAREMAAGNWHQTGEPIKFDIDGHLRDGQHRLLAIIQSGMTVKMMVVSGIAPEAQFYMDTGKKRSGKDMLSMTGFPEPATLAATGNLLWRWNLDEFRGPAKRPNHAELHVLMEENPGLSGSVLVVRGDRGLRLLAYPSQMSFCHFLFSAIEEEQTEKFFEDLGIGANLELDHPILRLRNRLLEWRAQRYKVSDPLMPAALVIKSWNAVRNDLRPDYLGWRTAGKTPERFPVPV